MRRIHVICEGLTEETFVNELLAPQFKYHNLYLIPSQIGQPGKKGGDVSYRKLSRDIRERLLGDGRSHCTTFFDYYGLPSDFPGKSEAAGYADPRAKAEKLCSTLKLALQNDIGENALRRFVPYVQMYEFEGLLFSDPSHFATGIEMPSLIDGFTEIRNQFPTPEHINDDSHTAPSKRLVALFPKQAPYEKPTLGTLAALEIGLPKIRQECPLFDDWLTQLENLQPLSA